MFCDELFTGPVNYIKCYNFGQLYQLTGFMSATQGPRAEMIQASPQPLKKPGYLKVQKTSKNKSMWTAKFTPLCDTKSSPFSETMHP